MLAQETVSWVAVTRTSDGLDVTYADATPVSLTAQVALRSADERFDAAARVVDGYTLYLRAITSVPGANDWFTVRGDRYEVDGDAFRWGSMGVVVNVKRAAA